MRSYKEKPEEGSLVVIKINDIHEHSIYAELEGFPGQEGLIHISEISRSWVRDIKKHVSEGEKTVAQVLETEEDSNNINLSLKRVSDKQKREKMQEWNRERKADKFIEKVAEKVGEDSEEAYEKVAFPFQKKFGNTFDGFEEAVVDSDRVKGVIEDKYLDAVVEVAEDNISLKQVKLEGEMEIEIPKGDGLRRIKEALDTGEHIQVNYISAPRYRIKAWGRNQDQAKKRINRAKRNIKDRVEENGGTFSFKKA
ncbi:MAG: S1 RNA-binding domain-containing protein [Candidatus Nanohaloarchaea archaeon]|nr:S1 RNA-binding domain-containing protein [Candidatus Nanohaloarchaea archaeon]